MAYMQSLPLMSILAYPDGLEVENFGLSLQLHPYFLYVSSNGTGKSLQ